MSLKQALKSRFKHEKGELEKEVTDSPSTGFSFRSLNDDELCLSHEDVLSTLADGSPGECGHESCRAYLEGHVGHIQEQLLATMLENQQLLSDIQKLNENSHVEQLLKELDKEKEKNRVLAEKLHDKEHGRSPRLELRRLVRKDKGMPTKGKSIEIADLNNQNHSDKEDLFEEAREVMEEDGDIIVPTPSPLKVPDKSSWREFVFIYIHNWFAELSEDFSETYLDEKESVDEDGDGDPLTVRKLKENIVRFGNATKPISNAVDNLMAALRWKSPAATLLIFSVYLYTVINGWFLPLILFLALSQLFINYLHYRGWFLVHQSRRNELEETDKDVGVSEKFHIVLQVARKVQNKLGHICDCFEKIKNLLYWEQPDVTSKLFFSILMAFITSCFLPLTHLLTVIGIYMGFKLFIIDHVYYCFPRIRQKYDTTAQMWNSLPTDNLLEKRHFKAEIDKNLLGSKSNSGSMVSLSTGDLSFCELFSLPASEVPHSGWHNGRRCTLINRDKSLTSAFKNGRLYLTNSFLCFERSKTSSVKNLVLPLKSIIKIEKAKPYSWIPGGGMALEVTLDKPDKTYIFGAIINRDEVFDSILEAGKKAMLSWAFNAHNESEEIPTIKMVQVS